LATNQWGVGSIPATPTKKQSPQLEKAAALFSCFFLFHMTLSLNGTLGIDFGTSNSAMAWADVHDTAHLIPLEGDAVSMPTAVFTTPKTT
jgi:hypothetical protein